MDQPGRAAATIAQPLEAEVYVDGAWWPGAVLGWRHDETGRCEAHVRVHSAGGVRMIGVELAAVRLPEAAGGAPSVPEVPAETVVMSRAELRERLGQALPGRVAGRRRRHASDLTAELPVVRCVDGAALAGRHRAPAFGGRHRAGGDTLPGSGPSLLTRPIRLDDVVAFSWGSSSAARSAAAS
ncbi:hypothetical protein SAMN05660991_03545 [Trujillonella endophytica]|uniref:Uncharacterized protein n=2 Tax=Trujillonella endophytica TaxID=673521 RepID=A0A1H8VHP8_9ACTN|nr:hypothetical protein SAMN05660991_03545 [Trujillella endophytica]